MIILFNFETTEAAQKALDKLYFSKWKNTCGFDIGGPSGVDAVEVRPSRNLSEAEIQEMSDFLGARFYTQAGSR